MNLENIKEFILKNDNFAIIGHVNPDGDCIGSCLGLWYMLSSMGKKAKVLISDDDVPNFLRFMWNPQASGDENEKYDAYLCLDCADISRINRGGDGFKNCAETACIDHHRTNVGFGGVNAIFPDAAATGEIIYYLCKDTMGISPKGDMADCLYTAIVSDTGGFKYSSTTGRTMRAGASLVENGVDNAKIFKLLFDTYTQKQMDIIGDITSTLTTDLGGKVATIYVTDELLQERGMRFDDVDFLVSMPRSIEGVEVGLFLKKKGDQVKVSLRSGDKVDVSKIALSLGGGGHMRAAGITIDGTLEEAKNKVIEKIKEVL